MANKKPLRSVWINQGHQPVAIVFAPSASAWRRTMAHLKAGDPWPFKNSHSVGHAQYMLNDSEGQAVVVIAINEKMIGDDPVELVCTLAHEAMHTIDWIHERMGEEEPGFEAKAYLMEHLMRELLTAYSSTLGIGKDWS